MYAIIATGGKQYKVSEGDIITIEKLGIEAGEKVTFDQVLAVSGDDLKIGNPTVDGATVDATVVKERQEGHRLQVQEKDRLPQEEWTQTVLYPG